MVENTVCSALCGKLLFLVAHTCDFFLFQLISEVKKQLTASYYFAVEQHCLILERGVCVTIASSLPKNKSGFSVTLVEI